MKYLLCSVTLVFSLQISWAQSEDAEAIKARVKRILGQKETEEVNREVAGEWVGIELIDVSDELSSKKSTILENKVYLSADGRYVIFDWDYNPVVFALVDLVKQEAFLTTIRGFGINSYSGLEQLDGGSYAQTRFGFSNVRSMGSKKGILSYLDDSIVVVDFRSKRGWPTGDQCSTLEFFQEDGKGNAYSPEKPDHSSPRHYMISDTQILEINGDVMNLWWYE